jgi:hypothetical protein
LAASQKRTGGNVSHGWSFRWVTLWQTYKKLLKMAIEIVDFPMKNGDFP